MIRQCEGEGCDQPARRRYCSDRCADTVRQRRLRARDRSAAGAPVERVEIRRIDISLTWETVSRDVLEAFADDRARFAAMGYIGGRRHRAPIARIDRTDAVDDHEGL